MSVESPPPRTPELSVALARSYEAIRASRRLLAQATPFPLVILTKFRPREPED